ncbi:MCE family protein [Saccharopolyspora sp. MS10]|uniref:MCE family protein n=1 Tax=Saccharopolyspora sp. MS10 TaxID=3385973 RepID=UPI0039A01CDD
MSTALRDRDQAAVGVVALALLTAVTLLAFFAHDLPLLGRGTSYSARFTESAGLAPGDEVELAGVRVGEVTDVGLDGDRVLVRFRVRDVRIGDRSRVSIEIKTLLGAKNLALRPDGAGEQEPGEPIPASRTDVPFDIPDALDQLARSAEQLDPARLGRSFAVLAESLRGAPEHLGGAVDGLSALSRTIASRDAELAEVVHRAADVSGVVARRDDQVAKLIDDGSLLLAELQRRREAISSLLRGTEAVSAQLRGLIADNQQRLNPALAELAQVTEMLRRNQNQLGATIAALEPYVTGFNNTVGNGRWFDGYLCGLLPPSVSAGPVGINPEGCDLSRPGGGP